MTITKEQIEALLKPELDVLKDVNEKENILQEITSFGLLERRGKEYSFIHTLFFEYFVSQKIVELLLDKQLKHNLMKKSSSLEMVNFIYTSTELKYSNEKAVKSKVP